MLDELFSHIEVSISSTQDVDSVLPASIVEDAEVSLTSPDGAVFPLMYDGDSLYMATIFGLPIEPLQGDFTLDVVIDEVHYSAGCELKPEAEILEPIFYWQEVMPGLGVLMMKAMINDTAGEDNYYKYKFSLQDGAIYQQGVTSDNGMDGKVLELYAQFNPAEELGFITISEDMAGSLYMINEGEEITITISQIDKRPYDFISTLGSSSSNPVCSFTGGECLGYFLVTTESTLIVNFSAENVVVL